MVDWRKTDEGLGIALEEESDGFSNSSGNDKFDLNMTESKKEEFVPSSKPIRKTMLISEIVDSHPELVPEITSRGMHCLGCGASVFETLEEGMMMHGMDHSEIDRTISELNAIIEKNSKPSNNSPEEDDFL